MDKRIDFDNIRHVFNLVQSAEENWESIGLGLGLSESTLLKIKDDKKNASRNCLYAVLNLWIQNKAKKQATWRVLIATLKSDEVNESGLADKIMKEKGFMSFVEPVMVKSLCENNKKKSIKRTIILSLDNLPFLLHFLTDVAHKWELIGLYLGISDGELKNIKAKPNLCNASVIYFLKEMLCHWLQQGPESLKLITVLENVGEKKLSIDLEEKFSQGDHERELSGIVPLASAIFIFERYLRSLYKRNPQNKESEWPPTLEVEYINLVLIQQDQIPIYSASEVKSKMGDIDEFRGKSLTLEEVTSYSSSHKVIIIEGCPGIGKTTLACKLCHDWAEKKLPWVKDYWLLLYIPLRTPLMRTAQSLADLLQYFEDNYSYDDYQRIKVSQGKGVLLILDGWDELRPSCRGRDMFFPRLIQGQVLPECSIIITSRPGATIDIRSFATRIIEILGFTEEQVSQYICSYFKSDISTGQKLIEDLEAYPNVASTCYVAVNLTIVCYVYKACGCQLPSTLTDVYELFIIHTIKRHFKKASVTEVKIESAKAITDFDDEVILKSLANLALRSLEKGDLIFNKEELMAECTVDETEAQFDGYGLLSKSSIAHKYGIEYYYHFLHLTIHEYLAAYSIFNMTERQQFDWLGKHIRNESFGMVLKFYCGMDKFQSRSARTLFSSEQTLGVPFALECIFEGQWKDACKKVAKQTSGSLSIIRPIQPYRALVYGYVMANAEAKWNLNWQKRAIEEQELKCLGRHILDAPNTLYKVSISHVLVISRKAVDMLSQILKTQYLLSSFTLNNTQFDDESVASICEAFKDHQMLQVLDLSNNKNLTEKCSEYICSLLPTLPSLKNLNIQGNNFGENGFKKILSVCPATIDVLPLAL